MNFDNIAPCQHILENNVAYIDSIYDTCFPQVKKMVTGNSGTEEDAHDIFQEAFIILFQNCKKEGFILSCKPCTFIISVAYRLWLKELKHRGKDTRNMIALALTLENVDYNDDDHMQRQKLIAEHFLQLKEKCHQILQLSCIEGRPGKEVAEKLKFKSYESYRVAKKRCLDGFFKRLNNDDRWNNLKN